MSLKHALLGLLTLRPMTGYELKQMFDSSVHYFWNAELSQIYPTLKALEENGLVDKHVEVQENRPNRKIYEVTPPGREEFLRWVRDPQPPSHIRDAFMIKVFFGTEVPIEDMLLLMRRQMDEHQMVLAFSEQVLRERIREAGATEHVDTRTTLFWSLTLEMAISYRQAYIEWCERSIRMLEESVLEEGPPHMSEHTHPHAPPAPADERDAG